METARHDLHQNMFPVKNQTSISVIEEEDQQPGDKNVGLPKPVTVVKVGANVDLKKAEENSGVEKSENATPLLQMGPEDGLMMRLHNMLKVDRTVDSFLFFT